MRNQPVLLTSVMAVVLAAGCSTKECDVSTQKAPSLAGWEALAVQFTDPAPAAGKTEFEGQAIRVRVTLPPHPEGVFPHKPMIATVIVENKRSVLAHVDAKRSCLIDPKCGAVNLSLVDLILPPERWLQISNVHQSLVTMQFGLFGLALDPDLAIPTYVPSIGASQQIRLVVTWEDGQTESADLSYEVTARKR